MQTTRNFRPRAWRRIAAVVGLAAVTLGMAVVPPAAAADVSTSAVATVPSARIFPPGPIFHPKHVRGDREYSGHGPDVVANATLNGVGAGTRNLTVKLCMTAVETSPDFTTADSCAGEVLIYRAPLGQCVQSVSHGTFDELRYTDTDHSDDVFVGQISGSFVQSWVAVGDTSGDDAGVDTGVSIFTRDLTVTSAPC